MALALRFALWLPLLLWMHGGMAAPSPGAAEAHVVALHSGTLTDLGDGSRVPVEGLPMRRALEPRQYRRFLLELRFALPDPAAAPLWAVYFRALNDGGRVRVNGTPVGEVPSATPGTAVLHVRPAMFMVAPELLHPGANRVEVEWATHDSLQHLARAFVGPAEPVRAHFERRLFWQNTMAQVGFDFALVSAAILLGIFTLRPQERRYLLMGLTSLGWAVVCVAYFLPAMPAALYPWWHLLRITGIAVTACGAWLFLMEEVAPGRRGFWRLCLACAAIGPVGFLARFALYDSIYSAVFETSWGIALLLLGAWPIALLLRALLARWDWRHAVFLVAASAGLLAGIADVGMAGTGGSVFGNVGYTAQATSPIWFSAIVLVLVTDFARFLAQQKRQNQLLARRLAEQQAELQHLHQRAQQRERERVLQEERQRIMQDMHDGLGSQLVSSLVLSERGALDAAQTSALLRDCIDDLRLAIDSLAASDDAFAVMAGNLRFRMEPRLRAAGIALQWSSAGLDEHRQPKHAQTLPLLRILQEGLGNALKHSGASEIAVTLETLDAGLRLCIRDNGRGFDAAQVRWGKGLRGMEKRARALGARLDTQSAAGTCIQLTLPL
ncbi:sensor histidine kinase [Pseudorhodoferax sp.]|uniref:sensor histidine kinase n=1 Tax=Pseudorhodoferax sp. TaxID=1993553 RepID=UPI002DD69276|nr:ATP-binding protein [Pseudorhodoferax sp.]